MLASPSVRRYLLLGGFALATLIGLAAAGVWIANRIGTPASAMPPPARPPNWAEVATAIAAFVALFGIVVAWKTSQRARHVALMAHLSERWDDELLVESRRLAESYSPERLRRRIPFLIDQVHPELFVLLRMPDFLEDLAVLEENGAISFEMIRKSLGGTLVKTWDHWQPAVSDMRGDQKYDLVYEQFEALAERMREALRQLGDVPGEAD